MSTMAAARQKEMKDSMAVVATSTFVIGRVGDDNVRFWGLDANGLAKFYEQKSIYPIRQRNIRES